MPIAIILGGDGVINECSDDYIKSADEWIPIPGSLEAISRLKKAGYAVTVASNQTGLGRGLFKMRDLQAMHEKMHALLAQRGASIDGMFFCPHIPEDNCVCRKPKPGLLLQIAQQLNFDLKQTIVVCDSLSDIKATRMAGAIPVLVKTGRGPGTLQNIDAVAGIAVYDNLSHFARELLAEHGNK